MVLCWLLCTNKALEQKMLAFTEVENIDNFRHVMSQLQYRHMVSELQGRYM